MGSWSNTSRLRRQIGTAIAGSLLVLPLVPSPAYAAQPARANTLAECMAGQSADQDYGCYEIAVASTSPSKVVLRLSWDRNTSAEGFNNADWLGGVWMQRWPVAGQWPKGKYPKGVEQVPAGKKQEECAGAILASKTDSCYRIFTGARGSLDLAFDQSMAGYVYEIQTADNICSVDRSSCGPSDGSLQTSSYAYAFILKAYTYKNKAGKKVAAVTCPAASKRSSPCAATLAAKLVNNIGGGSPVSISSGA